MAEDRPSDTPRQQEHEKDKPKRRREIPLVSVPDETDEIEEEMADLFEEDQVTHRHGSSEPEAD